MSKRVLVGRVLFVLLLVIVTILTVIPNPPENEPGFAATRFIAKLLFGSTQHADKVGHFLAYLSLGGTAALALARPMRLWPAPLGLALYGAALEGVQHFIAARSMDGLDALANSLGAAVGFLVGSVFIAKLFRQGAPT